MNIKEFEYLHVIKKLKSILGKWWNVEVLFFNEDNLFEIESYSENDSKESFKTLFQSQEVLKSISGFVASSVEELRGLDGEGHLFKKWDLMGTDVLVKPIYSVSGEFMGSVVVLWFFKDLEKLEERLSEVRGRLASLSFSDEFIEKQSSRIKAISEDDRRHLSELVNMMCEEIGVIYKEISNREQRLLEINKAYSNTYSYKGMVGRSKPMQDLYALLEKIKSANSTIMIQGENGTGKELIARAIHKTSACANQEFVSQNCSAFNDNLLESELFGHVKGSFTGAIKDKKGLFAIADKGTFFLDEVGDTSPAMQVKILRVIQEGTFIPLGSTETKKVDVRIIAATNKDLKQLVEKGIFREDLYYRLNVINVRVPALRERKEDISILAEYFLSISCKRKGVELKGIDSSVLKRLFDYQWPGNVRELENEIERLVVLSADNKRITDEYLSPKIKSNKQSDLNPIFAKGKLKDAIETVEKKIIHEGLVRTGWNKTQLAKDLGISRASLIMKVDKYGLDKRKFGVR